MSFKSIVQDIYDKISVENKLKINRDTAIIIIYYDHGVPIQGSACKCGNPYSYHILCVSVRLSVPLRTARSSTTIETGPWFIHFLKSLIFSRENYILSSVLSVLSCYITCIADSLIVVLCRITNILAMLRRTCIAHTFHINGKKTKLMVGVHSLSHIPIDI